MACLYTQVACIIIRNWIFTWQVDDNPTTGPDKLTRKILDKINPWQEHYRRPRFDSRPGRNTVCTCVCIAMRGLALPEVNNCHFECHILINRWVFSVGPTVWTGCNRERPCLVCSPQNKPLQRTSYFGHPGTSFLYFYYRQAVYGRESHPESWVSSTGWF